MTREFWIELLLYSGGTNIGRADLCTRLEGGSRLLTQKAIRKIKTELEEKFTKDLGVKIELVITLFQELDIDLGEDDVPIEMRFTSNY